MAAKRLVRAALRCIILTFALSKIPLWMRAGNWDGTQRFIRLWNYNLMVKKNQFLWLLSLLRIWNSVLEESFNNWNSKSNFGAKVYLECKCYQADKTEPGHNWKELEPKKLMFCSSHILVTLVARFSFRFIFVLPILPCKM